jgi:hypothetical protein
VAAIDYSPYLCIPAAIKFREEACGGEAVIRDYCFNLARNGGKVVADILNTEIMNIDSSDMTQCCFANVKLPFVFRSQKAVSVMPFQESFNWADIDRLQKWLNVTAVKEFETYLQIAFHSGSMWVRLSGQIYLDLADFEWLGSKLKNLCERAKNGEFNH